jgi:hypothetical protein
MTTSRIVRHSLELCRMRTKSIPPIPGNSEPMTTSLYGMWAKIWNACSARRIPCTSQPCALRAFITDIRRESVSSITRAHRKITGLVISPFIKFGLFCFLKYGRDGAALSEGFEDGRESEERQALTNVGDCRQRAVRTLSESFCTARRRASRGTRRTLIAGWPQFLPDSA